MSDKRMFRLIRGDVRRRAADYILRDAPDDWVVTVQEPTRNLEQNALLWVLLGAFAKQLKWPVNGQMVSLEPEEWKDLLSAAFKRETQRVAMGLDGGMVMLGMRTSKMGKAQFGEFLEFVQATAADRGVELEHVPA